MLGKATRAALAVAGNELAHDVERVEKADPATLDVAQQADHTRFVEAAATALEAIEALDVWPDEATDTSRMRRQLARGEKWIMLAEEGRVRREALNHVAYYRTGGQLGYSGPKWVEYHLRAIEVGDDDTRDTLALAYPEYVGLWRAWTEIEGGAQRLEAVLRRS